MILRAPERVRAASFFLVPLGAAFVLEKIASGHVSVAAGYRAIVVAIVVGVGATVVGIAVTRHGGRGPAIGLAAALVGALGVAVAPVVVAAAIVAIVVVDARLAPSRTLIPWRRLTDGTAAVSVITLVLVAGTVVARPAPQLSPVEPPAAAGSRPDIYLVMLDGMGRQDVLADAYGHDSGPFRGALADRGYDIAEASSANYPVTALSLASLVNGQHLVDLGFALTGHPEPGPLAQAIEHNRMFDVLSAAGYETVAISSGYEQVSLRSADRFVDTGELNELELSLIASTVAGPVLDRLVGDPRGDSFRSRAFAMTGAVRDLAGERSDRPKLTFVHFPLPHAPFVVDADCAPVAGGDPYYLVDDGGAPYKTPAMIEAEIEHTVAQTACTERLAIEMLDGIAEGARPDSVVVVFSDHGPDTTLNWYAPEAPAIGQRLANLFAARTPGHDSLFADDATLVNLLPTILRTYLGVDIADQSNQAYFVMPEGGLVEVDAATGTSR